MSERTVIDVHWTFWAIGVAGLVYNLLGCMNFLSQLNADAVASMPGIYRSIVESRPGWGTAAFALAVFGGSLGCVLLLLRKSVARHVFVASVIGAVAAQAPFIAITGFPLDAWIGGLGQVAIGAFLTWYSSLARRKDWIG